MSLLLLLASFFSVVAAGPFPPGMGQPGGPPFYGQPMRGSMDPSKPMGGPMGTGERRPESGRPAMRLEGKEQWPPRPQENPMQGPWGGNMGVAGANPHEPWRQPMQDGNSEQPTNRLPVYAMEASAQRGPPNKPPGAHGGPRPGGPKPGHPDMKNPNSTDSKRFIPIFKAQNVTLQNASLFHFKEGENIFLLPMNQSGVPQPQGGVNAPQELGYGYGLHGFQPYLKVYFSSSSPQTVSYEYGILSPMPAFLKAEPDDEPDI